MRDETTAGGPVPLANALLGEALIGFGEVTRRFPKASGRGLHVATVHRWRKPGVAGVRLESLRVGGRWMTTLEAIDRFVTASNAARDRAVPAVCSPRRRQAAAARRLDAEGL